MTTVDEKTAKKEALKARSTDMEKREKELNASRSGKGLRLVLGMTRGKNPQEIQYEAFDESQPKTLPETLAEFMELSGVNTEPELLPMLIEGFNSFAYTTASDPVAEFYEGSWTPEQRTQFRNVIRNYASMTGNSIEDSVSMIKPGVVAGFAKAAELVAAEKA